MHGILGYGHTEPVHLLKGHKGHAAVAGMVSMEGMQLWRFMACMEHHMLWLSSLTSNLGSTTR